MPFVFAAVAWALGAPAGDTAIGSEREGRSG